MAPTKSAGSVDGRRTSRTALLPPAGTRDLVWPDSVRRRDLARVILGVFSAHGYDLVTTPPFELETVLARGLESRDPRDLLRFVEPDSGEVALLRPDITPQIARVVATRLTDRPLPMRLCYEGSVLRRRRGRARRHRQIAQAGVEQIGIGGPEGDVEVIALAARCCSAVGLTTIRVELGHVGLVRATLREVPDAARGPVADALGRKDAHELGVLLERATVGRAARKRAQSLVRAFGDADVIDTAARTFTDTESRRAIAYLRRVADSVRALGDGVDLGVDLGDARGASYYTGVSFALLAHGPGEPVGSGGRYDDLLGRFDAAAPATGFALDLDNIEWALESAGVVADRGRAPRIAVIGRGDRVERLTAALRQAGADTAIVSSRGREPALAFVRAWGYDAAVVAAAAQWRVIRAGDGAEVRVDARVVGAAARVVAVATSATKR